MNLSGDESDDDLKFTINENYAKNYDKWRQGEELQKLKDKYGEGELDSDSSSSEEEDEEGIEWTDNLEKEFFKALSSLKEKNPKIYDKSVKFFNEETSGNIKEGKKKETSKFYSIGDYQRDCLLEKQNKFVQGEITNAEEEKDLKNNFKKFLNESDNEDENIGWGGLFKKRVKTVDDLKIEEADYKLWLSGEKEKLKNEKEENELRGLYEYWNDPNLDKNEKFLKDYILNKRFLVSKDQSKVPPYHEIVQDSHSDLSADENNLVKQEEFEKKYNFRFEEPDCDFIKRFPRTLQQTMRKKNERRKKHREEVNMRKQSEKIKKIEELKRLKALKKKEIMDRIKKLQEITGNESLGFQPDDLEDDFNPEEHDRRMSELFDEKYYKNCFDGEKPEYPELDEELEIENWDSWEGRCTAESELHCEDPNFNMDCDYEVTENSTLKPALLKQSKKCKKRRKSNFAAAVARDKPLFDPLNKTFEKYIDEYYALNYEDLIGDLPCRFKYRKVIPNDFGLSIEEILEAPDKELNNWVSIKKIMQRRPKSVELFDVQAYQKKASSFNKKKTFLPSLYKNEESNQMSTETNTKKKFNEDGMFSSKEKCSTYKNGKNYDSQSLSHPVPNKNISSDKNIVDTKKDIKSEHSNGESSLFIHRKNELMSMKKSKFKQKEMKKTGRNKEENSGNRVYNMSKSRLKYYGINAKKFKNKLRYTYKNTKNNNYNVWAIF